MQALNDIKPAAPINHQKGKKSDMAPSSGQEERATGTKKKMSEQAYKAELASDPSIQQFKKPPRGKYSDAEIRKKFRDHMMKEGRWDPKKGEEQIHQVAQKSANSMTKEKLKAVMGDGGFKFNEKEQKVLSSILGR